MYYFPPQKTEILQPLVTVRLLHGSNSYQGLVQIHHLNKWGVICSNYWGDSDASVVCRQLGIEPEEGERPRAYLVSNIEEQTVWLDNVQCSDREMRLEDCANDGWAIHNCTADSHFAAVNCRHKGTISRIDVSHDNHCCLEPKEHSLRLVNGHSAAEGHVQVYYKGVWGAICHNGWSFNDARVACRQMGFADALR